MPSRKKISWRNWKEDLNGEEYSPSFFRILAMHLSCIFRARTTSLLITLHIYDSLWQRRKDNAWEKIAASRNLLNAKRETERGPKFTIWAAAGIIIVFAHIRIIEQTDHLTTHYVTSITKREGSGLINCIWAESISSAMSLLSQFPGEIIVYWRLHLRTVSYVHS